MIPKFLPPSDYLQSPEATEAIRNVVLQRQVMEVTSWLESYKRDWRALPKNLREKKEPESLPIYTPQPRRLYIRPLRLGLRWHPVSRRSAPDVPERIQVDGKGLEETLEHGVVWRPFYLALVVDVKP